MMVLGLLPVIFWMCIFLVLNRRGMDWRTAFLAASILFGVVVTALTEIPGVFSVLNFAALLSSWALLVLISFPLFFYSGKKKTKKPKVEFPLSLKVMLGGVAGIATITAITAAVAPPNTWDSMTYHMGRVMHWLQNRSVDIYPTNIVRQNELTPWAEYVILHFQILAGGDYFANFVQWFSMLGSLVGVSAIAKELGAEQRGQTFAAVFAATLPMGILQSTSTQNDYVVAFWLVCFVYFGLLFRGRQTWLYTILLGASLGLAFLTKATAYIYAFSFFCWTFFPLLKADRFLIVKRAGMAVAIALIINSGFYCRNISTFNSPLYSSATVSNHTFGVSALISNIARNISLHLGTPWETVNRSTGAALESVHDMLGIDINDPGTTFASTAFSIITMNQHEDSSGNLLHLIMIGTSLFLFLYIKELRGLRFLQAYAVAAASVFVLFCFYLQWQPWHSRLHLPIFVLWSPFAAAVLSRIRTRRLANSMMFLLVVASLPWVLTNASRPLLSSNSILTSARTDMYFNNQPWLRQPYYWAASRINGSACRSIGLQMGGDDWEYPLWVLLQKKSMDFRIEHVNVTNKSNKVLLSDFKPCAVIMTDTSQNVLRLKFNSDTMP